MTKNLSRVDDLDSLELGESIFMDSIGHVFYTGNVSGKMEFAYLHDSGYIFAFRGLKENAMLRNAYALDFKDNEIECRVYSQVINPEDYTRCINLIRKKEEFA